MNFIKGALAGLMGVFVIVSVMAPPPSTGECWIMLISGMLCGALAKS